MQYIKDTINFVYYDACKFSFIEFNLILLYSFGINKYIKKTRNIFSLNIIKKENYGTLFYNYKSPLISNFLKNLISFPILSDNFQYDNLLLGSEIIRRLLNVTLLFNQIDGTFYYYCIHILKNIRDFIGNKFIINIIDNKKIHLPGVYYSIINLLSSFDTIKNFNKIKNHSSDNKLFGNIRSLIDKKRFNVIFYKIINSEFYYNFTKNSILLREFSSNFNFNNIYNPIFMIFDYKEKIHKKSNLHHVPGLETIALIKDICLRIKKNNLFSLLCIKDVNEIMKFTFKKYNIKIIYIFDKLFLKCKFSTKNEYIVKNKCIYKNSNFSLIKYLNIKFFKKIKVPKRQLLVVSFYTQLASINFVIIGKNNKVLNTFIKHFYHSMKSTTLTHNFNTIMISYYKEFLFLNAFLIQSLIKPTRSILQQQIIQMFSNSFAHTYRIIDKKNMQCFNYFINIMKFYWRYPKIPVSQKLVFFYWKLYSSFAITTKISYSLNVIMANIKRTIECGIAFTRIGCSVNNKQ